MKEVNLKNMNTRTILERRTETEKNLDNEGAFSGENALDNSDIDESDRDRETIENQLNKFLEYFCPDPDENIYIQTFPSKNAPYSTDTRVIPQNFPISRNNLLKDASLIHKLKELNKNQGIAFVVNAGGIKATEISRFNAFFIDLDYGDKSKQLELIESSPLQPNLLVETARGFHCYWLINGECTIEEWKDIQKRLIVFFSKNGVGADEKIINPNRAMRLPYLNHIAFSETSSAPKYSPVKLQIHSAERRYTLQEMQFAFPPLIVIQKILSKPTNIKNEEVISSVNYQQMKVTNFNSYKELADELRSRMKMHPTYKENSEKTWGHLKGVCHNGKGNTALALNLITGAFICLNGCSYIQILKAFGLPPVAMDVLENAPLTDVGNAECLAAIFGNKFRYCSDLKEWFEWNGVCWKLAKSGELERAIVEVARFRQKVAIDLKDFDKKSALLKWAIKSENFRNINQTLQAAQFNETFVSRIEQYDNDPYLVSAQNGTVNLITREFYKSKPQDFITLQLGANFDSNAKAPRFEKFIEEVCGGDLQLADYLQRIVGYSLTGDTSEQEAFILQGSGANGKSVFLDVISRLLGNYGATASFLTFDAGKRSENSNDLAALKGKRFVSVIETEQDKLLAEAKLKSVTGQDNITARFLYGEFFTYKPQFKVFLAVNHKPGIRGTDRGIWRRIRLIPFTQSFEGREDRHLRETLLKELSGILNWALEGLRKWQESGLTLPDCVKKATQDYKKECDVLGQWIDERIEFDNQSTVSASELYRDYKKWAEENGYYPFSQKSFGLILFEKGFKKVRKSSGYYYEGIRIFSSLPQTPTFDFEENELCA